MPKIDTSVIVLNWNGRAFLEPCLASLFRQTYRNFEIVLVDNGSSDGSVEFVRERFSPYLSTEMLPRLKIVAQAENLGFAGGNLVGMAEANPQTAFIATLNNDAIAEPEWLEILLKCLKALPQRERWGAICGYLLFEKAKTINSAGIEVYRNGLTLDRLIGQKPQFSGDNQEVFGASAGAAIYRREAIEDAGGFFDDLFFAYLEDADLAWRLRLRGWKTLFVPEEKALVWHAHSGTGKQGSPFKSFQLGRNRWWVILKNTPPKILLKTLPSILFYDFSASVYLLLKGDLAAIRGRLAAFNPQKLLKIWETRQMIQKYRTAPDAEIQQWLKSSPSPLASLKLRKTVDQSALS
jgi:GT2 family glycosyltransferase